MSENTIELSECIEILEFIGSIPENHKPCYNTRTTIETNSWFTTVRRRWGGEKGEYGVVYVNNIIDSCDYYYNKALETVVETKNTEILRLLKGSLIKSISGIDNLIKTYSDQNIVSEDYKAIKTRINEMILDLSHDIKHVISCNYDQNHGWGYLSDDISESSSYETPEKKPLTTLTSLSSIPSGDSKTKFFTTENIILLKPL